MEIEKNSKKTFFGSRWRDKYEMSSSNSGAKANFTGTTIHEEICSFRVDMPKLFASKTDTCHFRLCSGRRALLPLCIPFQLTALIYE